MRILVHNDEDGHCQVYDISTDEKFNKIFTEYLKDIERYEPDGAEQMLQWMKDNPGASIGDFKEQWEEIFEMTDVPGFDRSCGGFLYIEKLRDKWYG